MGDTSLNLPIRTENDGDVVVKLADATVPSQQLKVESDGSINTNSNLQVGNVDVSALNPVPVDIGAGPFSVDVVGDALQAGTVDGTDSGTQRTFVNNKKQQILNAHDVNASYTWLDFNTKQERVSTIVYTSATFPGDIITRTFTYTLVDTNYRLDTEIWTSNNGG